MTNIDNSIVKNNIVDNSIVNNSLISNKTQATLKKKSPRKKTPPKLSLKQDLLFEKITEFYAKPNNINILLNIVNSNTKISLRIIDWFVTNYSKKNFVVIRKKAKSTSKTLKKDNMVDLNVFLDYKALLKGYSKKLFDPFCRRERVSFKYNEKDSLTTTVGQLHFFKWAIENGIIKYIEENLKDIEADMNSNIKKSNNDKKSLKNNSNNTETKTQRKKRRELSQSAVKSLNKHTGKIVLSFD